MNCPRCPQGSGRMLYHETYEGVPIDRCEGCGGIWLDERELEPILNKREMLFEESVCREALAAATSGMSETEKSSVEPCPLCSKAMLPMNWGGRSGVIIDRCVGHGIWFDQGELEKIQAIHEHWEDRSSQPEFRQEVKAMLDREAMKLERSEARTLRSYGFFKRGFIRFLDSLLDL